MACKACSSKKQDVFGSEIAIHFPATQGLTKPALMEFPQLIICMDCGFSEFTVSEEGLKHLLEGQQLAE